MEIIGIIWRLSQLLQLLQSSPLVGMAKELPTENKACDFHDQFSSVKLLTALLQVHIKLVINMHVDEHFGKL